MKDLTRDSVKLSFFLRHAPQQLKLDMDEQGYVLVAQLLANAEATGWLLTEQMLNEIVGSDLKQRYSFSPDREYIRANQGHSTNMVKIKFNKVVPPTILYHGTGQKNVSAIAKTGLLPMKRHHVHLSDSIETAKSVGSRHGTPVIFRIDAKQMLSDGFTFFISENSVYLIDSVPVKYMSIVDESHLRD